MRAQSMRARQGTHLGLDVGPDATRLVHGINEAQDLEAVAQQVEVVLIAVAFSF